MCLLWCLTDHNVQTASEATVFDTVMLIIGAFGLASYILHPSAMTARDQMLSGRGARHRNAGMPRMLPSGTYPRRRAGQPVGL